MNYLPAVDGLRAVAVGVVFLFHLTVPCFSGGFIGVDVFFVISGFLITRSLLKELHETDTISISQFFLRRICRLLPALWVCCGLTICGATLLLSQVFMFDTCQDYLYALFAVSNLGMWQRFRLSQGGYFDSLAYVKPLLHTWSLGVEEQFYLLWPFLLLLVYKFAGTRTIWTFLGILFLASLGENILHFQRASEDSAYPFYFTHCRAFEFCIGALSLPLSRIALSEVAADTLRLLGLIGILASSIWMPALPFPHWYALIPCVSTVCVLIAGERGKTRVIFVNQLALWLGKRSYSIYLYHWPLIVLLVPWSERDLHLNETLVILLLTLVLAHLSYEYVEQRWRYCYREGFSYVYLRFGTVFLVAISCALVMYNKYSNGMFMYGKNFGTWDTWDTLEKHRATLSGSRKRQVLVVGDSQAADFVNLVHPDFESLGYSVHTLKVPAYCYLMKASNESQTGFAMPNQILKSLYHPKREEKKCKEIQNQFSEILERGLYKSIVLSRLWDEEMFDDLASTVQAIATKGVKLVIVGPKFLKSPRARPKNSLLMRERCRDKFGNACTETQVEAYTFQDIGESVWKLEEIHEKFGKSQDIFHFSWIKSLCPNERCKIFADSGEILFSDSTHFYMPVSRILQKTMQPWIERTVSFLGRSGPGRVDG